MRRSLLHGVAAACFCFLLTTAARAQTVQLLKDGKETLLEALLRTAGSGQKSTSESIKESIDPSEYESASLLSCLDLASNQSDHPAIVRQQQVGEIEFEFRPAKSE